MSDPPPWTLFDTHCHLEYRGLRAERDDVVARACEAGVTRLLDVPSGWSLQAQRATVETATRYPGVWAAVGVHPHEARHLDDALVDGIEALARSSDRVVAIGEIGLDYHHAHSPRAVQREVFARMLDLARRLDLPVVVHTREAEADTLEVLDAHPPGAAGGVVHCFTGSLRFARACLDRGLHVSISGVVTFRNAGQVPDVARDVPADRLLVETDSPFLAPVPLRGRRNEPAYVVHTARHVATLRGVSFEALAATTTANALRLFRL